MKYNLSKPLIKEYASHEAQWILGVKLFQNNRVHLISGINEPILKAAVIEKQTFDITLNFSKLGDVMSYECSCHEHDKPCQHVVATLLELTEKGDLLMRVDTEDRPWPFSDETIVDPLPEEEEAPQKSEAFEEAEKIVEIVKGQRLIHFFENAKQFETERLIRFIPFISFNDNGVSILFKTGEKQLYVIKDVQGFYDAYHKRESIYYGQKFTFDPSVHRIDPRDKPLFYFVESFIEDESQGFTEKQTLHLSPFQLKEFIACVNQNNLLLYLKSSDQPLYFVDGLPQFKVQATYEDDKVKVNLQDFMNYHFVDESGYFIWDESQTIYKMPEDKRQSGLAIKKAMGSQNAIHFPVSLMQDFYDTVLPVLNDVAQVTIDESLKKQTVDEPIEVTVFLDYINGYVSAKINFRYGNVNINPMNDEIEGIDDNMAVCRDKDKENEILRFFEEEGYLVVEGEVRIVRDYQIYDFIHQKVVVLAAMGHVKVTDRFRQKKIVQAGKVHQSIRVGSDIDYLEYQLEIDGVPAKELKRVLKAYREKKRFYLLSNGQYLSLESLDLDQYEEMTKFMGVKQSDLGKPLKLPVEKAYYLDAFYDKNGLDKPAVLEETVARIKDKKAQTVKLPESLLSQLRSYQKNGIKWLKNLSDIGFGGILADDMGLGKTVQVLSYLLDQKGNTKGRKTIIVTPTSLIYNWANEIEKFTPQLSYEVIAGSQEVRREKILNNRSRVLITSYGSLRRDMNLYQSFHFFGIILDEAQHIKNDGSLTSKAVKSLHGAHRFALTGTPIENHLGELWSIFDFIMPGFLGSRYHFRAYFEKAIVQENDEERRDILLQLISPFILRRLKQDVLKELPDKIESQMKVQMTEEQEMLYRATVMRIKGEISGGAQRMRILAGLTRLRQICSHPASYLEDYEGGSGKLEALEELTKELVGAGHRVIIFSQFTSVLEILKKEIKAKAFYIDGSVKAEQRLEYVDRFNAGEGDIFYVSLKAGGTGLNLTGADTVIHFDPWWNPAVENQASDRAHRIGQTKVVHVIKMITRNTIEEKIVELQKQKQGLVDQIIQSGELHLGALSDDEIRSILGMD